MDEKVQCPWVQLVKVDHPGPSASLARPPSMSGCLESRIRSATRRNPGDTPSSAVNCRGRLLKCTYSSKCWQTVPEIQVEWVALPSVCSYCIHLVDILHYTLRLFPYKSIAYLGLLASRIPDHLIGQKADSVTWTARARRKHQAKIHTCITSNNLHIAIASS